MATSEMSVSNSFTATTSESSVGNTTTTATSESSVSNTTTEATSESSVGNTTTAATSESSVSNTTTATTSETSIANSTTAVTSEMSITNSVTSANSETSTANSTTAVTSEMSTVNSTTAATSETSTANSSMATSVGTSVSTNVTPIYDISHGDHSVTTALSKPPIPNTTQEPMTTVDRHNSTTVTETTSPVGTFPTRDNLLSTDTISAEKTTVPTHASSISSSPLSPHGTDYSHQASKSTLPAARSSSTDLFQSERLRLNGKVDDLKEQVQSLTIALAVVSAVLGIIILIFIIYRLVIYLRGRGKASNHIIDDLDGKPEKKRPQVSYFRPQSNYYDIGDKEDNPSVSFANETAPGKADSLVTFNNTLTTSDTHSNNRELNESDDSDPIHRIKVTRTEGKLSQTPNNSQTAHQNNTGDNAFVEINLV